MKNFWIVIIVLFVIVAGMYLLRNKIVIYSLPRTKDPEKFGPAYWKALHGIAEKIPCPPCRNDGTQLMAFMHDVVNLKLGKKIYNQENYSKWKKIVCEGPQSQA